MTKITIVDDNDPQLKYTGNWLLDGANGEFDQTSHGSTTLGSQVTFTFHGGCSEQRNRGLTHLFSLYIYRHIHRCCWHRPTNRPHRTTQVQLYHRRQSNRYIYCTQHHQSHIPSCILRVTDVRGWRAHLDHH
jgi:hypothetical protein